MNRKILVIIAILVTVAIAVLLAQLIQPFQKTKTLNPQLYLKFQILVSKNGTVIYYYNPTMPEYNYTSYTYYTCGLLVWNNYSFSVELPLSQFGTQVYLNDTLKDSTSEITLEPNQIVKINGNSGILCESAKTIKENYDYFLGKWWTYMTFEAEGYSIKHRVYAYKIES